MNVIRATEPIIPPRAWRYAEAVASAESVLVATVIPDNPTASPCPEAWTGDHRLDLSRRR